MSLPLLDFSILQGFQELSQCSSISLETYDKHVEGSPF